MEDSLADVTVRIRFTNKDSKTFFLILKKFKVNSPELGYGTTIIRDSGSFSLEGLPFQPIDSTPGLKMAAQDPAIVSSSQSAQDGSVSRVAEISFQNHIYFWKYNK